MADVRFSFVSDKEVAEARENRVPLSTKRHCGVGTYTTMGRGKE